MVEIPARIQEIKAPAPTLACRWREQTRELFEACFAAGYAVIEFVFESHDGDRRSYYVLEQDTEVI